MKTTMRLCGWILLVLQISPTLRADEWSSGGGDPVESYFVEGRLQAADILTKLTEYSFRYTATDPVTVEAVAWVQKNQQALAEELQKMKFSWTHEPKSKCASTEFTPFADVKISIPSCRGTISSKEEAGKQLIHEAAHHLQVEDHEFAAYLGILVYQAWENLLLHEVTFCEPQSIRDNILASRLLGAWKFDPKVDAVLSGGAPFTHDYDPTGTVWTFEEDAEVAKIFLGFGKCVYQAGWASVGRDQDKTYRFAYVLAEWSGNPTVFIDKDLGESEDGKITAIHPRFMMIARGNKLKNDILFQGGDNNNQRLYAFRRTKAPPKSE